MQETEGMTKQWMATATSGCYYGSEVGNEEFIRNFVAVYGGTMSWRYVGPWRPGDPAT